MIRQVVGIQYENAYDLLFVSLLENLMFWILFISLLFSKEEFSLWNSSDVTLAWRKDYHVCINFSFEKFDFQTFLFKLFFWKVWFSIFLSTSAVLDYTESKLIKLTFFLGNEMLNERLQWVTEAIMEQLETLSLCRHQNAQVVTVHLTAKHKFHLYL